MFLVEDTNLIIHNIIFQLSLIKHVLARCFLLVTVPAVIYVYIFYIHLTILTKAGPHDNVMTSAFQASLEVSRELGTGCYMYIFIFIYI